MAEEYKDNPKLFEHYAQQLCDILEQIADNIAAMNEELAKSLKEIKKGL
jgi:uncharacterized protein YukE